MDLMRNRIGRLNKLLSDLLAYSRAGQEASDPSSVSLQEIVANSAEMLDPDDRYHIRYSGPGTVVHTYATPLQQILLNLISNAIKHHDVDTGQIVVAAVLDKGRIHFSVQDDGPGIDPQFHDRIFALFQTLRSRDDVEGSGLGLAIIRKLVERYGGAIRVRSDPETGRGAIFSFDLPNIIQTDAGLRQAA